MLTTQRGGQAERETLCAVSGPVIPNILRVFARVASRSRVRAKGKASHESHSKVTPFSIPCQRGGDLMNQKPGKKTLPSCPDVVVPNDLIVQVPQHATSRAARKTIRAKNKKRRKRTSAEPMEIQALRHQSSLLILRKKKKRNRSRAYIGHVLVHGAVVLQAAKEPSFSSATCDLARVHTGSLLIDVYV